MSFITANKSICGGSRIYLQSHAELTCRTCLTVVGAAGPPAKVLLIRQRRHFYGNIFYGCSVRLYTLLRTLIVDQTAWHSGMSWASRGAGKYVRRSRYILIEANVRYSRAARQSSERN